MPETSCRRRLAGKERRDLNQATDAELLLHVYAASGTGCVDYLLGDFGFALWDEENRLLWCATDHMGIRPVFYERHHHAVVVSNTLDCVRLHPESSGRLNDSAIADFLVHDFNLDSTSTVYAGIGRVGPGSRDVIPGTATRRPGRIGTPCRGPRPWQKT